MANKIYTIIGDVVEYKTKCIKERTVSEYEMKTSKSGVWTESNKNKTVIEAYDSGNDLEITFNSRDGYDEVEEQTLIFDYEQAFQLYCFLDLWHKTDPHFERMAHVNKKPKK